MRSAILRYNAMWLGFPVCFSIGILGVWRILFFGRRYRVIHNPLFLFSRKIGIYDRNDDRAMRRFLDIKISARRV